MTPCQDPANDPEDWFIARDGKQYSDDILVSDEELKHVHELARETYVLGLDDLRAREALVRRRHAKDKCFTCPARIECLMLALPDDPLGARIEYGTFGGYTEDERRKMAGLIDARTMRGAAAKG